MKKNITTFVLLSTLSFTYAQTNTFPTTGNVGIGTTTPNSNLEIANTNGGKLTISTSKANGTSAVPLYPSIDFAGYDNGLKAKITTTEETYNTNGSRFSILLNDATGKSNLVERFKILWNGNIGIGTPNPLTKLDVRKDLNTNDYANVAQHTSQFQIGRVSDNKSLEFAVLDNGTSVIQSKEAGIGYNTLVLNPINTGNVGIGTLMPQAKLDVAGGGINIANSFPLQLNGADINHGIKYKRYHNDNITLIDGPYVYGFLGGSLGYKQGSTEVHVLNWKYDNVGIGTTNPQAKLDVNGGVKISDVPISTSLSDRALVIDSQGNVKKATTMNGGGVYPSEYFTSVTFPAAFTIGNYIEFASASPIAANSSGYYEISIAYTRGNIAAAATYIVSTSHANSDIWREAGIVNANDYVSPQNRNFTIDVNGATNKFRIRAINTLGISADLEVSIKIRSINMVSSFSSLNVTGSDNSVIKLQPMTNEWNLFVGNPFSTESASIGLKVNESGNVGIGIINPKNKLDVNGTVHAKEVKIDLSGWADYVFKKDYDLKTLEEVERYIEEKGHLPNIPSSKEVVGNGINLGEMNSKLLEKIEELTLYSIEQSKQIKKLQEEIIEIKSKK